MSNLERVDEVVGTFLDHLVWVTDTSVHLHCTRLDSENTPAKHKKKTIIGRVEKRRQLTSGLSQWHSKLWQIELGHFFVSSKPVSSSRFLSLPFLNNVDDCQIYYKNFLRSAMKLHTTWALISKQATRWGLITVADSVSRQMSKLVDSNFLRIPLSLKFYEFIVQFYLFAQVAIRN